MTTQPYQATEERKHLTTGGPGKEQGTKKLPATRILQRSTRGQQEMQSGDASGKESACQCRRCKRLKFNSWVRKTPGEGNGNLLQYSGMEKFHGQRSLASYSS